MIFSGLYWVYLQAYLSHISFLIHQSKCLLFHKLILLNFISFFLTLYGHWNLCTLCRFLLVLATNMLEGPRNARIKNLQIYSSRFYDSTEKRAYMFWTLGTQKFQIQIYSILEHVIPNFWAQQKDDISIFYNSTEKRAYMFWTLGTQKFKIYKSTAFWSM